MPQFIPEIANSRFSRKIPFQIVDHTLKYSIDLKIGIFPCERDFYFFEFIRLGNYSSNLISLEIIRLGEFRAIYSIAIIRLGMMSH